MVRHKNRYFVVEVNAQQPARDGSLKLSPTSLHNSITQKIQQLHGDFGVAATRAGLASKYCNEKTRLAVVKARHGPHRLVGSALACVANVDGRKVSLGILYTGATMRHCFKFILNYQQKKVDEACARMTDEEEISATREAYMNFGTVAQIT